MLPLKPGLSSAWSCTPVIQYIAFHKLLNHKPTIQCTDPTELGHKPEHGFSPMHTQCKSGLGLQKVKTPALSTHGPKVIFRDAAMYQT